MILAWKYAVQFRLLDWLHFNIILAILNCIFEKSISDIITVFSEIICNIYTVLELYCCLTHDNLRQDNREIYYDLLFIYEPL